MDLFGPATRAWFEASFDRPTPVQERGWAHIAAGEHALLTAPTGSGKTLAAFLWSIDRLSHLPEDAGPGVRVLYVSPLKALAYDVERNLRAPLVGIRRAAERLGLDLRLPSVDLRTGDTPPKARAAQARHPAEVLVTTPESLYLLLGSKARETLRTVEVVIVDEVHAVAATKRGAHLMLSLERLAARTAKDPQRIGLSATVRPLDEVASFLGGDRPVSVVDASAPPLLDLEIVVPLEDMSRPSVGASDPEDPEARSSVWPAIHPKILELVRAHRTTIVFTQSRGLCERLAHRLNELAEDGTPPGRGGDGERREPEGAICRAHHGSLSQGKRREIEEALKSGELRCIVATSSLELGIDMGSVDLFVQVESPKSVARGLQRIGRAGHGVGEVSIGRVFPKHRADLLEATVVAGRMLRGDIEPLEAMRNPLDVLAQQVVAMTATDPWRVDDLERVVRRTAAFRDLSRDALVTVLDMLSGRYPSSAFSELRPRITWDRETDVLVARRGAGTLALLSGGTIPDRGHYAVHLGHEGPRVGELDEEMVFESRNGQTFTLGASTWRIQEITRDRVVVSPAPGEVGRLPFWKGDGPGRPAVLGRAIGAFVRELGEKPREEAERWLRDEHHLDALAARNLAAYVAEQREATGTVPTDRSVTIERFRDEIGDWRVAILSPFGGRVHAAWALAIEAKLGPERGHEVQSLSTDDGLVLRFLDSTELPDDDVFLPDPDEVEELCVSALGDSALFTAQFRENAARALLLPRRRPGKRTPLWQQRLRAKELLAVAKDFPAFPILLETYRSCLRDVLDVPALTDLLRRIRRREVEVVRVETAAPSPFARSLVFWSTMSWLYEGDQPLAERRAQALSLDRHLLRELLGHEELRELLDPAVVAEVEAELQHLPEPFHARHPDALHDLLRKLGDLSETEVAARTSEPPGPWLEALRRARRAVTVRIAGEPRDVAIEDAALYRDALGTALPAGVPAVFLESAPEARPAVDPLDALLLRYARTHGPFPAREPALRFGLREDEVARRLDLLSRPGVRETRLVAGDFRPGGAGREWCDPEVLRRLRRRTLAKLRDEVAPVEAETLARFLPAWHGAGEGRRGLHALDDALSRLEALPLSFRDLEDAILPARVADFRPQMLDELGADGSFVWVGHGTLGPGDGRIALYRRDRAGLLLEPPAPLDSPSPLQSGILAHLASRGASFLAELAAAAGAPRSEDLLAALWDLVWAGHVTNDTFHPLRSLGVRRPRAEASTSRPRHAPRGGRTSSFPGAGGRWSLVAPLLEPAPAPTERAHARALLLLERHGVLARESTSIEAVPGGFSALYPVLRALEEAGRVRRGWFVEGLGGNQFAWPGAVDRLRAAAAPSDRPTALVLAATDPASPFGATLPWPSSPGASLASAPSPRRAAGARVVLAGGEPVLYLEKGGKSLLTFPAFEHPDRRAPALAALASFARSRPAGSPRSARDLRIDRIDGLPARSSPLFPLLRETPSFTADHKGLVLESP